MAHRLPLVFDQYLRLPEEPENQFTPIVVESEAWYKWLADEQNQSFTYRNQMGTITVRCERKRRSCYWYAYRKRDGKLRKAYVGKTEVVTLTQLNSVLEVLSSQSPHHNDEKPTVNKLYGIPLKAHSAHNDNQGHLQSVRPATFTLETEPANPGKHNLPVQLTSFIGREDDIQAISIHMQRPDIRLLTLTGTGGIGKTRLAVQVASELLHDFTDGICFVSLALLSDPELVLPTIAQTLSLKETSERSLQEQLYTHLRTSHKLLVLDNFEQVVEAAPLLTEIVTNCPQLKILVTSRTILHVQGEQEWPVASLALPELKHATDNKSLTQYASVALFLARAQASKPDFQITAANARAIVEICIRLDGLPLAIELAAKRVKVLSVEQIAARLNDAFRLLTDDNRTVLPRQQTLQATIEWSYNLLSEQEQTLFCRLCVFAGGCTLEAIEAICISNGIEKEDILALLSHLIDQSLVYTQEWSGEVRYRLLQVIQQYGQDKLEELGEVVNLWKRHRDWYLGLAEQAEQELVGRQQAAWMDRLEAEHENLRAALRWSLEQNEGERAARIGASLWSFWLLRGYLSEGRQWLDRSLEQISGRTALRAKVLRATAIITGRQGDASRATSLLEESLNVWRSLGDKKWIAFTLNTLGVGAQMHGDYELATNYFHESLPLLIEAEDKQSTALVLTSLGLTLFYQGDHIRARTLSEEGLAVYHEVGDLRGIAAALTNLSMMSLEHGDYEQASRLCDESLALRREVGDKGGSAHTLIVLGHAAYFQDNYQQSVDSYEESLTIRQELGEKEGIAAALEGLAGIAGVLGQARSAARLLGAAETLRDDSSVLASPIDRAFKERIIDSIRSQLGLRDYTAALAEGRRFTLEQALAIQVPLTLTKHTLSIQATLLSPPTFPNELTTREMEVLRLVAEGMTDNQVAACLVISPRTAQGHVRSIYNKIHVNSRSAATRYAIEHKLV